MRLVTWNCNKDRRHTDVAAFSLLQSLQPDVAAVQECIQSNQPNSPHCIRLGRTPKYDIAVLSNDSHELVEYEQEMAEPRYFLPVRITGALEFNLLAVWAQKAPTYVDAVWNGLDAYASFSCGEAIRRAWRFQRHAPSLQQQRTGLPSACGKAVRGIRPCKRLSRVPQHHAQQ